MDNHWKEENLGIKLNRWILKPIGAWPKSSDSRKEEYLRRLQNVACYCLIAFLMIPCILCLVLEVKNTYEKMRLFGPLSFFMMATIKYCSLTLRDGDIQSCVDSIQADWRNIKHFNDREIMRRNATFGYCLVAIAALFMYGGAVFYYLALPFTLGKTAEGNLTYRPLIYPVPRMLIDTRYNPANEIFFWVQCLSGFLAHSVTVGACSLATVFAMHACGLLEVLMCWLENVVDGREDQSENVDDRLSRVIGLHIRVLSFVALTEKTLREVSFVEVVGCTLNMCFLGYYFITEWEISDTAAKMTYLILLTSFCFNIFIFCYIGELINQQCKKVGNVSYMTEWYRLSGKRGHGLLLVIAMSNLSSKLTAGYIFELSLSSFGDVVKTSVAYLNMLRQLTD